MFMNVIENKKSYLLAFLIFPFMLPSYLANISILKYLFFFVAMLTVGYVIFNMLKQKNISYNSMLIGLFYFCYLISTAIGKQGDISRFIISTAPVIFVVLLLEIESKKDRLKEFIVVMLSILTMHNALNFLSIIVFPRGLYDARGIGEFTNTLIAKSSTGFYYLGYLKGYTDVHITVCGLCLLAFGLTKAKFYKKLFYFNYITALITNIIVLNISGLVALILIAFVFLEKIQNVLKKVSLFQLVSSAFLIWLMVVVFRIQQYLAPLFKLIGKDVTLTGRTDLWDVGISEFCKHFWLGNGVISREHAYNIFHFGIGSVHSFFLEILFYGGILAMTVFILYLVYINKCLYVVGEYDQTLTYYSKYFIFIYLFFLIYNSPQQKLYAFLFFSLPHFFKMYEMTHGNIKEIKD